MFCKIFLIKLVVTHKIQRIICCFVEVDIAVDMFRQLTKDDPCRLENMDTYSNLLYVKEMRAELSHLAHHVSEVDKYRAETCCVIGL
jgi:anaphase-promoting complex subunit 8